MRANAGYVSRRQSDQGLSCSDLQTAAATLATVLEVDAQALVSVITESADLDPGEAEVGGHPLGTAA